MIRNIQIILFFGIYFLLNPLLYAQNDWEDQREIEDAQIVVEKNKKIELPKATRKYEKIEVQKNEQVNTEQEYSNLTPNLIQLSQISPRLKVLKISSEKPQTQLGNYIEAGFGNYITPMLNVYVNSTQNSKYAYGAYFNHISSQNGPVEYAGMSDTKIGLNGKYFLDNSTFDAKLSYRNDAFSYYGFDADSVLINNEKDIRQNLNRLAGNLNWSGSTSNLTYNTSALFNTLSGRNNLLDINFGYNASLKYTLADKSTIHLNSDLILENAKIDTFSVNRTYFTFNPNYQFLHDGINITLGLNSAYDDDAINGGGKLHIYPNVFVNYPLFVNELNVFAGVNGAIERNSLNSLIDQNRWFVMSENLLFNNNKKIDFFAGLKGNFNQKIGYKSQISFKNYNNLHFFINDNQDSTHFSIVTDTGNTSVVHFKGELTYELAEKLITSLTLDYFSYGLSTLNGAFHRPNLVVGVNTSYNIQNKATLKGQLNYISGLNGFRTISDKIVPLNDIFDLNLSLDYKISNNFSTFVLLNNILNADYSYYMNYQNKRFNTIIGVSYIF